MDETASSVGAKMWDCRAAGAGKRWYDAGGLLHRDDGPAIEEDDGTRRWYRRGKLHREDGPAIDYADGTRCWWLDGRQLSRAEWQAIVGDAGLAQRERLSPLAE